MGPKKDLPRGSHVLNRLIKGKQEIFLSKARRSIALIFGVLSQLVDLYQVCSNCAPGTKNGLTQGHVFYIAYMVKALTIFLL